MNVTQENIDGLNAVLKVKVVSEDYQPKVESALKTYQKKANIPGFRPGKVPTSLIKKMHGKAILIESINQLLQDTVNNYLKDNNIDLLGQPLPKNTDNTVDWENQKEFEFSYEMGLAPKFELNLSAKDKFTYQTVKIDDELINKYVTDIAKRYGKVENVEVAEEGDLLNGDFVELDANGAILEGGIFKAASPLFPSRIKDEATKKALVGLKKEDKLVIEAQKLSDNALELAGILGITKEQAEAALTSKFQFTVKTITRNLPADSNQELFDKVYGPGVVNNEEEFRAKIKEELAGMFVNDSDRKLYNNIVDHLMENVKFDLPTEFLKRWIIAANEKPVTVEQVEAEFENYSKGIKWQLIENRIIKDNNLQVTNEEMVDYTKNLLKKQLGQYNPVAISDDDLNQTAQRVLSNRDEAQRIYTQLLGEKVMNLFKTKFTLEPQEIPFDDFFKKA
jgi:trigger factor